jgi:periplasmic protein TonB
MFAGSPVHEAVAQNAPGTERRGKFKNPRLGREWVMDYAQQQRNPLKHLIGLSLVVLLHIVMIYALVNGLARKIVEVIKKPIETKIVEEKKPPPPPDTPPPPPPKMTVPPPPFIPPPEININVPAPTNTISQVTTKAPPPTPIITPKPKPVIAATKASLARETCASNDPKYPPASIRNEETGTLVLHLSIDAGGNPLNVQVSRSSGHPRLDEAAKSWIMTCHFHAPTVDGKPVAAVADQTYTFTLNN